MYFVLAINVVMQLLRWCAYTEMVTPIKALLHGFTGPSRTIPPVLHNRGKFNSLEYGSSIVSIITNAVSHCNKVKQIDYTYL